jgi:RNA polymerase sigma factor (sigma-70 family)
MKFGDESKHEDFKKRVEFYLSHPDSREAENFLFRVFNLWITFFFQDYKERWGTKTFTNAEEDDLRQEVIIKFFDVLRRSPKFTYAQARIYLLRIFQTKCIDAIRSKHRQFLRIEDQASAELTIIPFEEDSTLTPIEIMQLIEHCWQKALEQSPNSTRKIINLLYEKAPYEQICQQLGKSQYSKNAFKQKVYRAKKTFRNTLLKILREAISRENLNSFEREVIKSLCEKIEKNRS